MSWWNQLVVKYDPLVLPLQPLVWQMVALAIFYRNFFCLESQELYVDIGAWYCFTSSTKICDDNRVFV